MHPQFKFQSSADHSGILFWHQRVKAEWKKNTKYRVCIQYSLSLWLLSQEVYCILSLHVPGIYSLIVSHLHFNLPIYVEVLKCQTPGSKHILHPWKYFSTQHNALTLKYWQFFFEYCLFSLYKQHRCFHINCNFWCPLHIIIIWIQLLEN
jgi:hypothetical protein